MKVLSRYFTSQIIQSVLFVLVAFLGLFAFFDLMGELPSVGRGGYQLQHAFLYVLLRLPGYVYELMPIAALIGTIYTLAQFAARSEFTIMRVSGMSTLMVGWILFRIGLLFMAITFLFGEAISPMTTAMGEKLKLRVQGAAVSQEFRSGLWTKDVIRENGITGAAIGSRFLNVREISPDGQLLGVKLYEFDRDFRLTAMISASKAEFKGGNTWRLADVSETRFSTTALDGNASSQEMNAAVTITNVPTKDLISEITPQILSVLFADPDRMSAVELASYTKHLAENKQTTERYEIAFWKKVTYPFAVFVMMALALPFAYLHARAGGVSLKIFIGIMIGVGFQLLNSLFSHIGLLNTWPALVTAILPSTLFLLMAMSALWWVERH
ncbi:MAG TPA: LPS export ABC transporter permease LptG [Oxalobacteraceae bacterium]|jgi:lipopolysaccharide export system permease protein|nr:LPS export ABC transporter permease LptG [Oxalobacteraceae bacterium]HCN88773.1 LPS export ABC transporter permease LptG [Oxalobacteraceae bacterium]